MSASPCVFVTGRGALDDHSRGEMEPWRRGTSTNFKLAVSSELPTGYTIRILRRLQTAARLLALYWSAPVPIGIRVFVYSSARELANHTGRIHSHCFPSTREMHLLPTATLGHELTHIHLHHMIGSPPRLLREEGLAAALDLRPLPLHSWHLAVARIPNWSAAVRRPTSSSSPVARLMAASAASYLVQHGGPAPVSQWITPAAGTEAPVDVGAPSPTAGEIILPRALQL
jgi:hypothetical protein